MIVFSFYSFAGVSTLLLYREACDKGDFDRGYCTTEVSGFCDWVTLSTVGVTFWLGICFKFVADWLDWLAEFCELWLAFFLWSEYEELNIWGCDFSFTSGYRLNFGVYWREVSSLAGDVYALAYCICYWVYYDSFYLLEIFLGYENAAGFLRSRAGIDLALLLSCASF